MRLRNRPMGWILLSLLVSGISFATGNSQPDPCAGSVTTSLRQIFSSSAQEENKILAIESKAVARTSHRKRFISAEKFGNKVPTNSWVKYQGVNFRVRSYDPKNGMVTLEKYLDKIETKANLRKLVSAEDFVPGKAVKFPTGDYQITQIGSWHIKDEDRIVHLAKITRRVVPIEDLNFEKDGLDLNSKIIVNRPDPLEKVGDRIRFLADETDLEKPLNFYGTVVDHAPQEDFVKKYGAQPDSPIRVQFFSYQKNDSKKIWVGRKKIIAFKDYPKEIERTLYSVDLLDKAKPDQVIARFERFKNLKGEQGNLFNVTTFKTNIYRFKIGRGSNAKKIKVFAPVTDDLGKTSTDLVSISQVLGEVPIAFTKDLDSLKFDPGGLSSLGLASSGPGRWRKKSENVISFYHETNFKVPNATVVESILSRPQQEIAETVWHELAHLYEMRIKKRIPNFDMTIWEDAIARDNRWVSQYSEISTGEDFAETILHYVRTAAGREDPAFRQRFKNRFELLDHLLSRVH